MFPKEKQSLIRMVIKVRYRKFIGKYRLFLEIIINDRLIFTLKFTISPPNLFMGLWIYGIDKFIFLFNLNHLILSLFFFPIISQIHETTFF